MYVNPDNRSPLQEDILDLPGLRTRLVEQLCRGRGLPAGLTGLLTGQHGGSGDSAGLNVIQAGLNVVHLVFWPSKFYRRSVNRSISKTC